MKTKHSRYGKAIKSNLRFQFLNSPSWLTLDPKTGVIRTKGRVDRESICPPKQNIQNFSTEKSRKRRNFKPQKGRFQLHHRQWFREVRHQTTFQKTKKITKPLFKIIKKSVYPQSKALRNSLSNEENKFLNLSPENSNRKFLFFEPQFQHAQQQFRTDVFARNFNLKDTFILKNLIRNFSISKSLLRTCTNPIKVLKRLLTPHFTILKVTQSSNDQSKKNSKLKEFHFLINKLSNFPSSQRFNDFTKGKYNSSFDGSIGKTLCGEVSKENGLPLYCYQALRQQLNMLCAIMKNPRKLEIMKKERLQFIKSNDKKDSLESDEINLISRKKFVKHSRLNDTFPNDQNSNLSDKTSQTNNNHNKRSIKKSKKITKLTPKHHSKLSQPSSTKLAKNSSETQHASLRAYQGRVCKVRADVALIPVSHFAFIKV